MTLYNINALIKNGDLTYSWENNWTKQIRLLYNTLQCIVGVYYIVYILCSFIVSDTLMNTQV